jgi:hypothetical protein
MRDWLRRRLWNVCWEIGDTFMGWAMKIDGPPDETWERVDIHANCQPKSTARTITLRWDQHQGLVEVPTFTTSTGVA